MTQDHETNKELAHILIQLFSALEDRVIDAREGAQLCRAVVMIIAKVKPRLPKIWHRLLLDTASNVLKEASDYLDGLEP